MVILRKWGQRLRYTRSNGDSRYTACIQKSDDLPLYWQGKERTWPKLSALAKLILTIPATITSSERSFASAGRTMEKHRSQLTPSSVDGLMFLHGFH